LFESKLRIFFHIKKYLPGFFPDFFGGKKWNSEERGGNFPGNLPDDSGMSGVSKVVWGLPGGGIAGHT
jgi:hypothetical protein